MTKDVLKSLASSCGEIIDVQFHLKEVPGGNGTSWPSCNIKHDAVY